MYSSFQEVIELETNKQLQFFISQNKFWVETGCS